MLKTEKVTDNELILHNEEKKTPYYYFPNYTCNDKFNYCAGVLDCKCNKD